MLRLSVEGTRVCGKVVHAGLTTQKDAFRKKAVVLRGLAVGERPDLAAL